MVYLVIVEDQFGQNAILEMLIYRKSYEALQIRLGIPSEDQHYINNKEHIQKVPNRVLPA